MKLKIKEINPNEFKKFINKGEYNEEQLEKIQSNIKELGLMGSLPVYKKGEKYHLVAGHHRLEALRRQFGDNYEISVELHDYSDENILRGMVVENLSQRIDDFREEMDNIVLIKMYLEKNINCSLNEQLKSNRKDGKGGRLEEPASIRSIYNWLNKQGKEVMSIGKISQLLKIRENLEPEVLNLVEKHKAGSKAAGITPAEAIALSTLPKEEQKPIADALMKSEHNNKLDRLVALQEYKNADEQTKEKVKSGEIKIEEAAEHSQLSMARAYAMRAIQQINDTAKLRKALYQFRTEKFWINFSTKEKNSYKTRLSVLKNEYLGAITEVDKIMEEM